MTERRRGWRINGRIVLVPIRFICRGAVRPSTGDNLVGGGLFFTLKLINRFVLQSLEHPLWENSSARRWKITNEGGDAFAGNYLEGFCFTLLYLNNRQRPRKSLGESTRRPMAMATEPIKHSTTMTKRLKSNKFAILLQNNTLFILLHEFIIVIPVQSQCQGNMNGGHLGN